MTQPAKVTDYAIVQALTVLELAKEVNKWFDDGWRLYGPPFVLPVGGDEAPLVCQAVVR